MKVKLFLFFSLINVSLAYSQTKVVDSLYTQEINLQCKVIFIEEKYPKSSHPYFPPLVLVEILSNDSLINNLFCGTRYIVLEYEDIGDNPELLPNNTYSMVINVSPKKELNTDTLDEYKNLPKVSSKCFNFVLKENDFYNINLLRANIVKGGGNGQN